MAQTYPSNGPSSFGGRAPGKAWSPNQTFDFGKPANDNNLPVPANDNEPGRSKSFRKLKRGLARKLLRRLDWFNYAKLAWQLYDHDGGMVLNTGGLQFWRTCSGLPVTTYRWLTYVGTSTPTNPICVVGSGKPAVSSPPGWAIPGSLASGAIFETFGQVGTSNSYSTVNSYWRPSYSVNSLAKDPAYYFAVPVHDPLLLPGPVPVSIPRPGFHSPGLSWPTPHYVPGGTTEANQGGEPSKGRDPYPGGVSKPVVIGGPATDTTPGKSVRPRPRQKPGKGVKERKIHVTVGKLGIGKVLGGFTELVDFINALYDALPLHIKIHDKWNRQHRPRISRRMLNDLETDSVKYDRYVGTVYRPTPAAFGPDGLDAETLWRKSEAIYRHWNRIDLRKALKNVATNELQDMLIGKASSKLQKSYAKNARRYGAKPLVGLTSGPAL